LLTQEKVRRRGRDKKPVRLGTETWKEEEKDFALSRKRRTKRTEKGKPVWQVIQGTCPPERFRKKEPNKTPTHSKKRGRTKVTQRGKGRKPGLTKEGGGRLTLKKTLTKGGRTRKKEAKKEGRISQEWGRAREGNGKSQWTSERPRGEE